MEITEENVEKVAEEILRGIKELKSKPPRVILVVNDLSCLINNGSALRSLAEMLDEVLPSHVEVKAKKDYDTSKQERDYGVELDYWRGGRFIRGILQ